MLFRSLRGGDKRFAAFMAPKLDHGRSQAEIFREHFAQAAVPRFVAAALRLDPNRIGAWGASAGGHLVALLGTSDQLQLARMKKRKLALKDEIAMLEDQLIPDIIA